MVSYALKQAKEAGFQVCIPPSIVRNEVIDSCGFRPRDMNNQQQIYHINDTSLGLTATAEIALAGLGINKVMDLSKGPRSVVGVSRSYRAEAGARGKDTKGLYRVHEFTKVELFVWAKPEERRDYLRSSKTYKSISLPPWDYQLKSLICLLMILVHQPIRSTISRHGCLGEVHLVRLLVHQIAWITKVDV